MTDHDINIVAVRLSNEIRSAESSIDDILNNAERIAEFIRTTGVTDIHLIPS